MQVLFAGGKFQWKRLENLIRLAREGSGGLDLSDTVASGARVVLLDERLRSQLLLALTEDNRLHIDVRRSPFWMSPHQRFPLYSLYMLERSNLLDRRLVAPHSPTKGHARAGDICYFVIHGGSFATVAD